MEYISGPKVELHSKIAYILEKGQFFSVYTKFT